MSNTEKAVAALARAGFDLRGYEFLFEEWQQPKPGKSAWALPPRQSAHGLYIILKEGEDYTNLGRMNSVGVNHGNSYADFETFSGHRVSMPLIREITIDVTLEANAPLAPLNVDAIMHELFQFQLVIDGMAAEFRAFIRNARTTFDYGGLCSVDLELCLDGPMTILPDA